eukprot:2875018-Rhodomonas_salina.2
MPGTNCTEIVFSCICRGFRCVSSPEAARAARSLPEHRERSHHCTSHEGPARLSHPSDERPARTCATRTPRCDRIVLYVRALTVERGRSLALQETACNALNCSEDSTQMKAVEADNSVVGEAL